MLRRFCTTAVKRKSTEGDISSVFPSLAGLKVPPLAPEFMEVQKRIVEGREEMLKDSWNRLLPAIEEEVEHIREQGNKVVPEVDFKDIQANNGRFSDEIYNQVKERGVLVIRNVLPRDEARQYKFDIEDYIKRNPSARGFPAENPTVFELYWSKPQLKARTHPNMIATQRALQTLWHTSSPTPQLLSVRHPLTYVDRLRIRPPGDSQFTLGPHIDGGSIERWEDPEYAKVYGKILYQNAWEEYDPFDTRHRLNARPSLHESQGQCSMFRMFQGWVSMSETGPNEGTLRVNPMLRLSTAYTLLRPFFAPQSALNKFGVNYDPNNGNLEEPWEFTGATSTFPNSMPGCGQELNNETHPHLKLDDTMVSIPKIYPGDFVAWHCDTIHAVESEHRGAGDSSVLYVPATPLTEHNVQYTLKQRDAFMTGKPGPDFNTSESGEQGFDNVGTVDDMLCAEGRQSCGVEPFDPADYKSESERAMLERSNKVLFGD